MQVGLGSIFSDIVREHPTIKNRVGERAFHYFISGLGCVRRFTDSYKQMCGCTECVGLHSLHRSLQAKHGLMHCIFAIDSQRRTTKARVEEMARGGEQLGGIPSHCSLSWRAPACDGHRMLRRTGSARHSRAATASNTTFQRRRQGRMPMLRIYPFTSMSTRRCCRRMARSGGGLSSYKSIAKLVSSTSFIIGPPSDAGGTT